jgi:hypothetical protein
MKPWPKYPDASLEWKARCGGEALIDAIKWAMGGAKNKSGAL